MSNTKTKYIAAALLALVVSVGCEPEPGGGAQSSSGGETLRETDGDTTVEVIRDDATDAPPAEGRTCQSNADCGDEEMCFGPEGCDVAWTCQPLRPCTRDLVVYCGCDGERHEGSGTCPPAPYAHRGPCEG